MSADVTMTKVEASVDVGVYAIFVVPTIMLRAYILTRLWAWFVVPLGAPKIDLVEAIGLSSLLMLCTLQMSSRKARTFPASSAIIQSVVLSLWTWGVCAIAVGFR